MSDDHSARKLLPREPSERMIRAAHEYDYGAEDPLFADIWRAMFDAAPESVAQYQESAAMPRTPTGAEKSATDGSAADPHAALIAELLEAEQWFRFDGVQPRLNAVEHADLLQRARNALQAMAKDVALLTVNLSESIDDVQRYRERAEKAEAERDAMAKDAERYRWIRLRLDNWYKAAQGENFALENDRAIDAARQREEGKNGP